MSDGDESRPSHGPTVAALGKHTVNGIFLLTFDAAALTLINERRAAGVIHAIAKLEGRIMSTGHMLLALALGFATSAANAQEIGQPGRGLAAAQRLCAQCHSVQNNAAASPNAGAPPFKAIASVPGMTAIALAAALNTSHREMPNILLEPSEQADIIAYILSLK
jgi:mono/diheme cytochrome c family protein